MSASEIEARRLLPARSPSLESGLRGDADATRATGSALEHEPAEEDFTGTGAGVTIGPKLEIVRFAVPDDHERALLFVLPPPPDRA